MLRNDVYATRAPAGGNLLNRLEWIFQALALSTYALGVGYFLSETWAEHIASERAANCDTASAGT